MDDNPYEPPQTDCPPPRPNRTRSSKQINGYDILFPLFVVMGPLLIAFAPVPVGVALLTVMLLYGLFVVGVLLFGSFSQRARQRRPAGRFRGSN